MYLYLKKNLYRIDNNEKNQCIFVIRRIHFFAVGLESCGIDSGKANAGISLPKFWSSKICPGRVYVNCFHVWSGAFQAVADERSMKNHIQMSKQSSKWN